MPERSGWVAIRTFLLNGRATHDACVCACACVEAESILRVGGARGWTWRGRETGAGARRVRCVARVLRPCCCVWSWTRGRRWCIAVMGLSQDVKMEYYLCKLLVRTKKKKRDRAEWSKTICRPLFDWTSSDGRPPVVVKKPRNASSRSSQQARHRCRHRCGACWPDEGEGEGACEGRAKGIERQGASGAIIVHETKVVILPSDKF